MLQDKISKLRKKERPRSPLSSHPINLAYANHVWYGSAFMEHLELRAGEKYSFFVLALYGVSAQGTFQEHGDNSVSPNFRKHLAKYPFNTAAGCKQTL